MTDLRTAIRQYLDYADVALTDGVRNGSLTIEEAKLEAADLEKWQQKLALLDAEYLLHDRDTAA
jgi:hypothetical protein